MRRAAERAEPIVPFCAIQGDLERRTLRPNAVHKLLRTAFDEIPRFKVSDTRIQRVTQYGEFLPLEGITHYVNNARVLASAYALLGECLEVLGKVELLTHKKLLAAKIERAMTRRKMTKAQLARAMRTSRTVVHRLLDPHDTSVTLSHAVEGFESARREAPTGCLKLMTTPLKGLVHGNTVVLDETVPPLEGKRVLAGVSVIARGDIRWFRFGSPDKRRPVLVLERPDAIASLSQIPVIPISTQLRGLPWEMQLGPTADDCRWREV